MAHKLRAQRGVVGRVRSGIAVLSISLILILCQAAFGQPISSTANKVIYYINSDSTKIWAWLGGLVSPYYHISIKDPSNRLYQVAIQDTTKIGADQHILLPEIPNNLHKLLAGPNFTAGTNSDIIELFLKRIEGKDSRDAWLQLISPPTINYFWHTERVCKIWLGDLGQGGYQLVYEPDTMLIASGLSEKSEKTGVELLTRSLPFLMNTRDRSRKDLLADLGAYLYRQRPNHEFVRPVAPHAGFYFQPINSDLVQAVLVSRDTSSVQSVLFKRTNPTGLWSKGTADIDLRPLGVAVNDKRPLVFAGYRDENPAARWTDLWHTWVEGGLSLVSPPHAMNQKDHIYRDTDGKLRWLWLELIQAPRFSMPEMAPKPAPIVENSEPVVQITEREGSSRSKFMLLGFGLGSTIVLLGLVLVRYGGRFSLRLKQPSGWGNRRTGRNGRAKLETDSAEMRLDQHPDQLRTKSDVVGRTDANEREGPQNGPAMSPTNGSFDIAQLNHRIVYLEKEIRHRDKGYGQRLAELDCERQELQAQLRLQSGEIRKLRSAYQQDLDRAQDEIKQQLAVEHNKAVKALRGKVSTLKNDLAAKNEAHNQLVGEIKEAMAVELNNAEHEYEQTLQRINAKHKEDLAALEVERVRSKQAHEEHVSRLKEECRDGMQHYKGLKKYVEGYQAWAEQVATLQFRLERAAINFHDREPETAGRILTMLNYSTSELLREFRPDDPDYENTRLAMITNVQILVSSVAKKHPEFHNVLRFMGKKGLLSTAGKINVVSEVPDKYANTYYHQLFKQLKGTTDRSGITIPKMYFVFPVQENGRSQNLILKIQSSV
ncbi:hypothetical protein MJD09_23825 [bacterium]|nr:hypothetical protein [bacterium]